MSENVIQQRDTGSNSQRGFTLVEVLIAMLVLTIGMLGLAALQVTSTRANQGVLYRTQAALFAQDMLERMRLNVEEARAGGYNIAFSNVTPNGPNCIGQSRNCSAQNLRAFDLEEWLDRIADELPSGDGEIIVVQDTSATPPSYDVTVSVRWFAPIENATAEYELVSRL